MDNVEHARSRFEQGFNCSQSVLSAYGSQLGLDPELALRVAGAFGGGMARMGRTCGAVTGALMVIGLQRGNTKADDDEAKDACYDLAREFVDRFEAQHGTITCQELLGCNINTPEGRALATEKGLFATLCPKLVQGAAEIVGQMLEE